MTKSVNPKIQTFDTFMNPVIEALKALGGSGTIEEINDKVLVCQYMITLEIKRFFTLGYHRVWSKLRVTAVPFHL